MTVRGIDISGAAPVDREGIGAGAVPELRWIRIADLVIDEAFQRPLERRSWTAINRIAQGFSWGKFAPVVASPIVGGKYTLIDGQHRTHAAALCGFDAVPAMIVVLTPEDQAASFAAINGNVTAMSGFHVYKAALAAGEQWAVASRDAVQSGGCRLMTSHPSSKNRDPRDVYCIATVKRFVGKGLARVVHLALRRAVLMAICGRLPPLILWSTRDKACRCCYWG